ncbi:MAG: hypothetical protein BWX68_01046 [Verrucomicrobia bacterium ADurb.Bin063]|nr:MAG: hypothetical protein BWX68_01046 [Verrucomicrobia bacterium ADurb.Bin063]
MKCRASAACVRAACQRLLLSSEGRMPPRGAFIPASPGARASCPLSRPSSKKPPTRPPADRQGFRAAIKCRANAACVRAACQHLLPSSEGRVPPRGTFTPASPGARASCPLSRSSSRKPPTRPPADRQGFRAAIKCRANAACVRAACQRLLPSSEGRVPPRGAFIPASPGARASCPLSRSSSKKPPTCPPADRQGFRAAMKCRANAACVRAACQRFLPSLEGRVPPRGTFTPASPGARASCPLSRL